MKQAIQLDRSFVSLIPDDAGRQGWRVAMAIQLGCALILGLVCAGPALAQDARLTVLEENDSILFDSDRYYTQGLQLDYLGSSVASGSSWNVPFDFLSDNIGIFPNQGAAGGAVDRRYEVLA